MSRLYLILIICMTVGLYGCGSTSSSSEKSGIDSVPKTKTALAVVDSYEYGYGYVDSTGKTMYLGILTLSEVQPYSKSSGTAAAFKKNDKGSKRWQFIDKTGKSVLEPEIQRLATLHSFSSGRAMFKDEKYVGYFDEKGKVVIPAQYGEGKDFGENGLAPVDMSKHNGSTKKWGYIDVNGNVKIPGPFADAEPFSQGLALVRYDSTKATAKMDAFINEKGEKVIQSSDNRFCGSFAPNGLALVAVRQQSGYKFGYMNKRGAIVIGANYSTARSFAENGLAGVEIMDPKAPSGKRKMWGFINSAGEWAIQPQYEEVGDFAENGLAPVKVDDMWGYIDQQGNMVIKPQFKWARNFVVF